MRVQPRREDDDEAVLIARMSGGDAEALSALYDLHAPAVYGLASALLEEAAAAEAATRDAFLALWRRSDDRRGQVLPVRKWLVMSVLQDALEHPRRGRAQ